ncbi:MAG: hypothetical protein LBJ31_10725 [Treponema sp.]|jgi:hypothetical protein|nr:hypothetical protein [Treponema sp.]
MTRDQREINRRILSGRVAANETYVADKYPHEVFISSPVKFEKVNKFTKGLALPKGVKVARSRIPVNSDQRDILRKELRQAAILTGCNNSVFLIPEHGAYKERLVDAVINGLLYEFRNITGNARAVEDEFRNAKGKGGDVNVFINIDSGIPKSEARRRIALVLGRHPDYTGKIIVSFSRAEKLGIIRDSIVYFWDTKNFR